MIFFKHFKPDYLILFFFLMLHLNPPSPPLSTNPPTDHSVSTSSSFSGSAAAITLQVKARVQGYTKAAFPVATFRDALAATLGVSSNAVAVLSIENLPVRREAGGGVSVASEATFPAGHSADAALAASRLAPETLTQNLRAGGMTGANVLALVATITDPAALSTSPATTPAIVTAGTGPRPDAAFIGEWNNDGGGND